MNFTTAQAAAYLDRLRPLVADVTDRDLFVLPPFPSLFVARDRLAGSNIAWGAQDVHPDDWGAHTGDVSAPMLADLGCSYVAVGHSERRRDHGETAEVVGAKVAAALRWGMTPVLCIGEPDRRGPGSALAYLLPDLGTSLARVAPADLPRVIVAYEPVWAIGEGAEPATAAEISEVHLGLRAWIAARNPGGPATRVIYGGSVDERIAPQILGAHGVDGLFVGRRALDPDAFAAIARVDLDGFRPGAGAAAGRAGTREDRATGESS